MLSVGERIAIIVSERIGDVIFCTPAISLLRACRPQSTIDVIALSPAAAQVFDYNPEVNKIYVLPSKKIIKSIRDKYDTVIDFHNSKKTEPYVKWLNKPVFISPRAGEKHQSEVAIHFIKSILEDRGIEHPQHYRLYPQPEHRERVRTLLLENGASLDEGEVLIGCHMGCYKTADRLKRFWRKDVLNYKTWPVAKFVELQAMLYQNHPNVKLVLTGSESEKKLSKKLNQNRLVNLMGKTRILDSSALMSYLKVFLTGDTGPLHIAAATTVPILLLLGPSFVETTGPRPLCDHHVILKKNPLSELSVEAVYGALLKFL